MTNHFRHGSLLLLMALASGAASAAQPASDAMNQAEAKQLVEDMSPIAQYNRSQREAHAAYAEAIKACRQMASADRSSCMQNAKANLQNDLAYAKQQYNGARQLTALPGSDARYQNARREAYAAYQQATNNCKEMTGLDKASCMKEARTRLQDDLAYARNRAPSQTSVGSSGTAGTTSSSPVTSNTVK